MNNARLFPNLIGHYRPSFPQDAAGGYSDPPAIIGTYACSVQHKSTERITEQGREGLVVTAIVYVPNDYGFKLEDRLTVMRGPLTGMTLIVQGPARDQAGHGVVWAIDVIGLG